VDTELRDALEGMVGQLAQGPLNKRLEAATDEAMDRAVDAVALHLAGGDQEKARSRRSAAIRMMVLRGGKGILDDASARA